MDIEVDNFDWRQTSSLVNNSEIYGRDVEIEELINKLLSNSDDFSTTLAQLVYNDGRAENYFDLRIWVCVSDDFEIGRLTRAIIESIDGSP
ncbi:hypothetical protein P3X46_029494 [Hevea brasiliensis]|uniref:Uncharacterized protein n=1 Tax=Hevea brasiliensis TaxID=3981 RepID=A0ABQ9KSW7_HEVBR|nr:hypothetical protein P3X46_029494 [Hevea brasiliensis]